eukprot:5707565-Pleurochrysis_carterae.AAC.1
MHKTAKEQDGVDLEQVLHVQQLLLLERAQLGHAVQVVPAVLVQKHVALPHREHAPQGAPRMSRHLRAHNLLISRRDGAAGNVPPPGSRQIAWGFGGARVQPRRLSRDEEGERLAHLHERAHLLRRRLDAHAQRSFGGAARAARLHQDGGLRVS